MATKQITDLTLATSFDPGDLLLLRKTGEGVDKAITQQKFIETLGNPSVVGFIATSTIANEVVLTPSNDVVVDKYYDQMVVTFISPITSTGAVNIKIAGLTNKLMQEIGTTTTSTLAIGKYYTAIFNIIANIFYQTNIVVPYIFTNEYTAIGAVQPGDISTKYALTTAIGTPKTATGLGYYPAMSALFTTDIASKGAIILNIDGMGEKLLQDPEGDDIKNNLLAKEAITAIYDSTAGVFRKRMFSNIEPTPIDPPDETVYVGPSRALKFVTQAIFQLITNYTENGEGRKVVIELDTDYQWGTSEAAMSYNTPWITIKSAAIGNNINEVIRFINYGSVNFTGTFNFTYTNPQSYHILIDSQSQGSKILFKDATLTNASSTTVSVFFYTRGNQGRLDFENVNVNNYDAIVNDGSSDKSLIFNYYTGVCSIKNNTASVQPVITGYGTYTIQNVNFGSVTKAAGTTGLFNILGNSIFNNVTVTTTSDINIFLVNYSANLQSVLTNCTMKNTSTSLKPAILANAGLVIDGGDYRHTLVTTAKDIFAGDYAGAVVRLRNVPLGATGQTGRGQIISE
jgi:hypothetical protein